MYKQGYLFLSKKKYFNKLNKLLYIKKTNLKSIIKGDGVYKYII